MRLPFLIFLVCSFLGCEVSNTSKEPSPTLDKNNVTTLDSLDEKINQPIKTAQYDYDTTQWTDLHLLDSSIIIDMRYATTNNFVKEKMYECGRCFLRPEVAR